MKKKLSILLCALAALFFGSCSSMSVDDSAALKADLPSDFEWKVYAKINKDVASSQVIFDVQNKNKAFTDAIKNENCANLLKDDLDLAQKVYQDYLACPMKGWNRKGKCPGIYAYNTNYSKQTDPETWQCIIGTSANTEVCWRGGWDDSGDNEENLSLLKDSLPTYLENLLAKLPISSFAFVPVRALCKFIPMDVDDVSSYLDDYINNKLDSVLVIEHYKFVGVFDGRPYKYCKGQHGEEKSKVSGKYFCLEDDQKIYVAQ